MAKTKLLQGQENPNQQTPQTEGTETVNQGIEAQPQVGEKSSNPENPSGQEKPKRQVKPKEPEDTAAKTLEGFLAKIAASTPDPQFDPALRKQEQARQAEIQKQKHRDGTIEMMDCNLEAGRNLGHRIKVSEKGMYHYRTEIRTNDTQRQVYKVQHDFHKSHPQNFKVFMNGRGKMRYAEVLILHDPTRN